MEELAVSYTTVTHLLQATNEIFISDTVRTYTGDHELSKTAKECANVVFKLHILSLTVVRHQNKINTFNLVTRTHYSQTFYTLYVYAHENWWNKT